MFSRARARETDRQTEKDRKRETDRDREGERERETCMLSPTEQRPMTEMCAVVLSASRW